MARHIAPLPKALIAGATAGLWLGLAAPLAQAAPAKIDAGPGAAETTREMTIFRAPGCGCCDSYAAYLQAHGYAVEVIDDRGFHARSIEAGVPADGIGCHLGMIAGYAVSGLVPVEIIERLLTDRPDIDGITLPGMPANAPGMAETKTGTLRVYAFDAAGTQVYSDE